MSDLERSLRALAGPSSDVDLDAVGRRAERIRGRRRSAIGGAAASLVLVAALVLATAWDGDEEQTDVVVTPTPETIEVPDTTEAEPEVSCPAPGLAPIYLPWAGELSEPPEPDRVDRGEAGVLVGYLDDPAAGPEVNYAETMAVRTSTYPSLDDLSLGPREATSIGEIRGHEAYLVWVGDPGVGGVFVAWDEDDGSPCSAYRVGFPSTGPIADYLGVVGIDPGDSAAIEEELIRVAESLVYVEPEPEEAVEIVQCPPPDLYPTTVPWDHGGGPIEPVDWLESEGGTRAIYSDMPEDYPEVGVREDIRMLVGRGDAGEGFDREAARAEFGFGEVRGTEAYLFWARDGGIGGASISWNETPGEACGLYTVSFRMNQELTDALGANWFDRAEAEAAVEAELIKVIEGLERR